MASNNPDSSPTAADDARTDLTAAVDELLNSLSHRFTSMSSEIFAKMDEMTRRLDNLEAKMMASEDKTNQNPANPS